MTVLLQISDLHFGTERPPVLAALRALVRAQHPDLLIVSGDITQRATRRQFSAACAFIEALGIGERLVIPGNHDIPLLNPWLRLHDPYRRYREAFGAAFDCVRERKDLLLIGLNTTRNWRHTGGQVSGAQIDWTADRLRTARPEQLRIVVTHQPVHVTRRQDAHNLLNGRRAAIRAWSEAGVDLIVGGHIHLPFIVELQSAFPALPRRTWALQAGTATSRRIRFEADNSVNLLRIDTGARCQVERWDYDPALRAFKPGTVTPIEADRSAV